MITLPSRLWCFVFALAALPLAAEESANARIPPHTIPEGTTFLMRLEDRLDTNRLQQGKHFKAKLAEDLTAPDGTLIPRGKKVKGHVSAVENGFHARLLLSFDEIETNHGWVPLIATVTGVPGEHGVKPPDEEGEIERRGMNKRHEVERAGAGAGPLALVLEQPPAQSLDSLWIAICGSTKAPRSRSGSITLCKCPGAELLFIFLSSRTRLIKEVRRDSCLRLSRSSKARRNPDCTWPRILFHRTLLALPAGEAYKLPRRDAMKFPAALLILVLLTTLATAQEHPAITAQPNTVFVGADGRFEANPDTALVQFNISAQEDTSRAAYERASKAAEQVRQILRANGIEPKAAEIGYFSLQPVYDYKNPKRKLVAYRVNANVSLKLKDFSKIAPIVQQLSESDVTENQSLNYTLEDMEAAKTRAVEDAYRRARESATAVARASGRTLGELSYASVDTFENICVVNPLQARAMSTMRMEAAAPAPTEEFTPQTVVITAHVNALFTLR